MKVSLILATVGRTDDLGRAIDSLIIQSDQNFELIVVDQNPDDRLSPFLDKAVQARLDLKHLRLGKPSLSGARNLGLKHATGDIVAFPDDDCWYEPEAIECARRRFAADDRPDGLVGFWVEQAEILGVSPAEERLSLPAWRRYRGGHASSISLFFKRALFDTLGGFDERFGVGQWFGAAEEIDFVLRTLSAGASVVRCPAVRVHHRYSRARATDLVACRSARCRARGTGGIYAKHRLPLWTIVRGLIAPWVLPLARIQIREAWYGMYVALGRLEGALRWSNGCAK